MLFITLSAQKDEGNERYNDYSGYIGQWTKNNFFPLYFPSFLWYGYIMLIIKKNCLKKKSL